MPGEWWEQPRHPNARCTEEPYFTPPEPREGYIDAGTARPRLEVFAGPGPFRGGRVGAPGWSDYWDEQEAFLALLQQLSGPAYPEVKVWHVAEGMFVGAVEVEVTNEPPCITRADWPVAKTFRHEGATYGVRDIPPEPYQPPRVRELPNQTFHYGAYYTVRNPNIPMILDTEA